MPADDDAIAALRGAVEAAPGNVSLRRLLGDLLLDRGIPAEAEAEFREALRRAPGNQVAKLGVARARHRQGRYAAAFAILEEILAGISPPPDAHTLLTRLLIETGQGKDALAEAARALAAGDDLEGQWDQEPGELLRRGPGVPEAVTAPSQATVRG
jgi:predicted Zn-dependent protease